MKFSKYFYINEAVSPNIITNYKFGKYKIIPDNHRGFVYPYDSTSLKLLSTITRRNLNQLEQLGWIFEQIIITPVVEVVDDIVDKKTGHILSFAAAANYIKATKWEERNKESISKLQPLFYGHISWRSILNVGSYELNSLRPSDKTRTNTVKKSNAFKNLPFRLINNAREADRKSYFIVGKDNKQQPVIYSRREYAAKGAGQTLLVWKDHRMKKTDYVDNNNFNTKLYDYLRTQLSTPEIDQKIANISTDFF